MIRVDQNFNFPGNFGSPETWFAPLPDVNPGTAEGEPNGIRLVCLNLREKPYPVALLQR
jgi:hypothetical protein